MPQEIVDKIKNIIDDYDTISDNCIEKVYRFDWNKVGKEYVKIYRNIIY